MTLYEISTVTLSAALLLTTAIYAVVNYFMLKEMKIARELRLEPNVILRLEYAQAGFFDIVVENSSENEVFDVVFTKHPGVMPAGFLKRDPGFLVNGIKYMAPKQSYRALILFLPSLYEQNQNPEDVIFEYRYSDRRGKRFEKQINISIKTLFDRTQVSEKKPR
jgi:hypothetical protein